MKDFFLLPVYFFKFWFFEAPLKIFLFLESLNDSFLKLVSLPVLVKTFFKPWKNEYREGLVGFSIGMGMFIKSFVIITDLILFTLLVCLEIIFFLTFVLLPIISVLLFFY